MKVVANAPGKLIISGEHAVVYGAPALAIAVEQLLTLTFTPTAQRGASKQLVLTMPTGRFTYNIDELPTLKQRLDNAYQQFECGNLTVTQLLSKPADLLFYTLATAGFCQNSRFQGGELTLASEIPMGAGMGSSAACIAALLRLAEAVGEAADKIASTLAPMVRFCERLQHGRGSLIDAATVSLGGMVKVCGDTATPIDATLDDNWFVWHSGTPLSSTGEVVAKVRQTHADSPIWQTFKRITVALEAAIKEASTQQKTKTRTATANSPIIRLIRENHACLCRLGVVPEAVAATIAAVEARGGAAKICGAGTLAGDGGGQVLLYLPEDLTPDGAKSVGDDLNIALTPLRQSQHGAHAFRHFPPPQS